MLAAGTGHSAAGGVFGGLRAPVGDADGKRLTQSGVVLPMKGAFLWAGTRRALAPAARSNDGSRPLPRQGTGDGPQSGIRALRSHSGVTACVDQAWGRGAQRTGRREDLVPVPREVPG